jgi:hypothetical protein
MSNQSWINTHQQRIQAEAIEGARRADLARQVAGQSRGLRASLAERLVVLAGWLGDRPRAAITGRLAPSHQSP